MKKLIPIFLACLLLTGCSININTQPAPASKEDAEVLDLTMPVDAVTKENYLGHDLASMDHITAYNELQGILKNAELYNGETFTISGFEYQAQDANNGKIYHACCMQGKASCCKYYMEYVLADEDAEYPDLYDNIIVTGVFDIYEEDGEVYYQLKDAIVSRITTEDSNE